VKNGIKTTEFWFGIVLAAGIYALIWSQKYPGHGEAGYEGIEWMLVIWGSYTGYRGVVKRPGGNGNGNDNGNGKAVGQIAADQ
jgi:hypothetical protein